MKKNQTDAELAQTWGCDPRTIRRWRKAGAPLDDPIKMRAWLAGQKSLPRGTAEILAAERKQAKAEALTAAASVQLPQGAASALKRLEAAEAQEYASLQTALASGDALEIKLAHARWLKTGDSLRRYDLLVEQSRRDGGELIPRAEALRVVEGFARYLGMCLSSTLEGLCPELEGLNASAMRVVMRGIDGRVKEGVISALRSWGFQGKPFPDWLLKPAELAFAFDKPDERNLEIQCNALKGLVEFMAKQEAAGTKPA